MIAYTPFFFTQWVNPLLRIGCFILVTIYFFLSAKYYSKRDALLFGLVVLICIIFYVRNTQGLSGLRTAGNYALTMLFGWGLYRHLIANRARANIFLGLYVKFFYLVSISSLLSLIYYLILGELDLFGFSSDTRTHLVTPFGVLFKKSFGSITLYRSFFYFDEPVYSAIFYAANIIIVAPLLKNKGVNFIIVNIIGGLLSMSATFVVLLFALYCWKVINSVSSFIFISLSILFAAFLVYFSDVSFYTSLTDRLYRFEIFFTMMNRADILQWLFGYGVTHPTGFDKAFSSGLALMVYETGIAGAAFITIALYGLNNKPLLFIFYMLSALVVDPIHIPLFWFLIVITSSKINQRVSI
jgi:hypothetical protein